MKDVIQEIFDELSTEHMGLSQKEFSSRWLCHSNSYWGYIKSSGADPSTEVMLRLWGQLQKQQQVCEYQLQNSNSEFQQRFLKDWINLYSDLSTKAHQALEEYALAGK